jgi:hypothetical protein
LFSKSINYMKIIGHHTCSKQGIISEIERSGPFLSTHDEDNKKKHKFLGTGYYFWDNNIGMAHAHGQRNYKRKYYIFQAELEIEPELFLDLVGNRIDMLWFQETMERFEHLKETQNWTMGSFIEFLKRKGFFPYKAIRAVDNSIDPKEMINFVDNRVNSTNLNPVFIVCLLEIDSTIVKSFTHFKTFPTENV